MLYFPKNYLGGHSSGYSGDGGLAIYATLYYPQNVAVDSSAENIYIADTGNNCIRKVIMPSGIIDTLEGYYKRFINAKLLYF